MPLVYEYAAIDLLEFLKPEPEGKYLDELDTVVLPQVSDALLMMVQFETALTRFKGRYQGYESSLRLYYWKTPENMAKYATNRARR